MRSDHGTTRIALAMMLVLSNPMWAATIIVDETSCTLVDAVTAANTDTAVGGCAAGSGDDSIQLTTDVMLTEVNNGGFDEANGLPRVVTNITVEGGGFTIERDTNAPPFRLFYVENGQSSSTLTLNDVALLNGRAGRGGAIRSDYGTLFLTNSLVSNNTASVSGGGIYTYPNQFLMTNCTVSGNTSTGGGGGIAGAWIRVHDSVVSDNVAGSSGGGILGWDDGAQVRGSIVSDNHAGVNGGGIHSSPQVFVRYSTVSDNSASESGGGIYLSSPNLDPLTGTLLNSTLSGNSAGQSGGGIFVWGPGAGTVADLTHCTLSGNSAPIGGGTSTEYSGVVNFQESIVANSAGGGNCDGNTVDEGGNYSDDNTCGPGFAVITGLDPILADNGGPTPTHALLPGSSAIDAGGDCDLDTDQRGFPRDDGACDSGAYELQCYINVSLEDELTRLAFEPAQSAFDIVTGDLAILLASGSFADAVCMGSYPVSPAIDPFPDPIVGGGRYYLARGLTSCVGAGYGGSSLDPDPRDALLTGPCP